MSLTLDTPVEHLNRVGKVIAKRLRTLGIHTLEDLLFYFPFRYEDFSRTKPIADLESGEQVTVKATIEVIANKRSPRKRMVITEAWVADATGRLRVVWFGQPFIAKNVAIGDTVFLSGKITKDMFGPQMVGPAYERVAERSTAETVHTARIVPMYSLTAGMTQKQLRYLMKQAMPLVSTIQDWLPESFRQRAEVLGLASALRLIHFPGNGQELQGAERRLKFDELFLLQVRAEMIRRSLTRSRAFPIIFREQETKEFVSTLPFVLTKDQRVAAWEILRDMAKETPMNRLVQGDVGSGKTVVAALALYNALLSGYQAVMIAPTEILAKQHFESLEKLFGRSARTLALFTRSERCVFDAGSGTKKTISKKQIVQAIQEERIQLVVGTHALLSDPVAFGRLALAVVDEQHRFGVAQRKKLKDTSDIVPHFLSMTATPIPRSLALTVYGDLDVSVIREKPLGRRDIKTRFVEPKNREKAYQFIREQVAGGRQVFVICPLIEEGEEGSAGVMRGDEKKSVMNEYKKLSGKIFPDLRVGYMHGKMKSGEKDTAMKAFAAGEIDVLVSTSVVEVGVNVPNASVMMIEGAEHFGLAQLHQFRGRVGRSEYQSYCFLFSDTTAAKAARRLSYFEKQTDGFALAEFDLEERGPGEVYGTAQSGEMQLRLATMRDHELIRLARELARDMDIEAYPAILNKVKAWEETVHLE